MQPESRLWALHVGAGVASPGARVRKAGSKVKFEKKNQLWPQRHPLSSESLLRGVATVFGGVC